MFDAGLVEHLACDDDHHGCEESFEHTTMKHIWSRHCIIYNVMYLPVGDAERHTNCKESLAITQVISVGPRN